MSSRRFQRGVADNEKQIVFILGYFDVLRFPDVDPDETGIRADGPESFKKPVNAVVFLIKRNHGIPRFFPRGRFFPGGIGTEYSPVMQKHRRHRQANYHKRLFQHLMR